MHAVLLFDSRPLVFSIRLADFHAVYFQFFSLKQTHTHIQIQIQIQIRIQIHTRTTKYKYKNFVHICICICICNCISYHSFLLFLLLAAGAGDQLFQQIAKMLHYFKRSVLDVDNIFFAHHLV